MTDRIQAIVVTLTADVRSDDVQPLAMAISQLRGVATVTLDVRSPEDLVARERVRHELMMKLMAVLQPQPRAST